MSGFRAIRWLSLICIGVFMCCGCTDSDQAEDTRNSFPDFDSPRLAYGKSVWLETCKECHAHAVAGAPKAGDAAVWRSRYEKGRETLYVHAIEGFYGPGYTHMPPRGGNADLSDEDVQLAVDYMLALAGYL